MQAERVPINDDHGLECEADTMGARASEVEQQVVQKQAFELEANALIRTKSSRELARNPSGHMIQAMKRVDIEKKGITWVKEDTYAVTPNMDLSPLSTGGMGPCIGLTIVAEEDKAKGALAHFSFAGIYGKNIDIKSAEKKELETVLDDNDVPSKGSATLVRGIINKNHQDERLNVLSEGLNEVGLKPTVQTAISADLPPSKKKTVTGRVRSSSLT